MPSSIATSPRPVSQPATLELHSALRESVVVAIDGGPAGMAALRWLAQRSAEKLLRVELITVIERHWIEMYGDGLLHSADETLEDCASYLADLAPNIDISSRISWGVAREEIALAAVAADLLVVGTNRTHALPRALGGSLPMRVVESVHCPVVIVPEDWTPIPGDIVIGVQGDESDEEALRFAADACLASSRPLRIVHAWDLPLWLDRGTTVARDVSTAVAHAQRVLRATEATMLALFPEVEVTSRADRGDAAEVLERHAVGAALLVVGTHGSTVLDRFFVGSVSRALLTRPTRPIAIIRPRVHTGPSL